MKKISVAIITYNQEKYIEQAVRSVLMQKGNFELQLVIGNDCSKDNTSKVLKKLVKEFPNKIKLLDRKKNIGAVNNLLDTMSYCDGDYVAVLEGDDYWLTDHKLKDQFNFLEKHKDYFSIGTDVKVINQDNEFLDKNPCLIKFKEEYKRPKDFFMYNYFPSLSIFYRNKKGTFDELLKVTKDVAVASDYGIKTYFVTKGKLRILPEKLGVYRYIVKSGSSYSASGIKGLIRGYNDVIKSLENLLDISKNYKYKKDIQKEIMRKKIVFMLIYIKGHEFSSLFKYIHKLHMELGLLKAIGYVLLIPIEALIYIFSKIYLRIKAR